MSRPWIRIVWPASAVSELQPRGPRRRTSIRRSSWGTRTYSSSAVICLYAANFSPRSRASVDGERTSTMICGFVIATQGLVPARRLVHVERTADHAHVGLPVELGALDPDVDLRVEDRAVASDPCTQRDDDRGRELQMHGSAAAHRVDETAGPLEPCALGGLHLQELLERDVRSAVRARHEKIIDRAERLRQPARGSVWAA